MEKVQVDHWFLSNTTIFVDDDYVNGWMRNGGGLEIQGLAIHFGLFKSLTSLDGYYFLHMSFFSV